MGGIEKEHAQPCRWQRLNRSLERVSAVHDGGENARSGAAANGSHARGIAVHAVKTVSATQGWACTQVTPEQASNAGLAQEAALQLQDSQQSACLPREGVVQTSDDPADEREHTVQQREAGQPESQTGSYGFSSQAARTEQPQADAASGASAVEVAGQDLEASLPSEPAGEVPQVSLWHLAALPYG